MAYQTGTATSQENLIDQLRTFASGNGWTVDNFDTTNDRCTIHKGTIYVSFRWDNTTGIAIFHSLGFVSGPPENNTNDSGNGDTSGTVASDRRLSDIGNGPFPAYHFFVNTSPSDYIHVVLEYATNKFRHMSFGSLVKTGTWTGGEYCAGTVWDNLGTGLFDTDHCFLMDGINTLVQNGCTVHVESPFPNVTGSTKWGVVHNNLGSSSGNDRGGVARVRLNGGIKDGWLTNAFDGIPANPNNGFIPMWPVPIYHFQDSAADEWRFMGVVPDIRVLNGKFLNAGEEFVIGSDTWKVFPWIQKTDTVTNNEFSGHAFVAYRKT